MTEIFIREAEWQSPTDCSSVLKLIDAYALEPIEGGQPLPDFTRENLIAGLQSVSGAFVLLACIDSEAVGIAVCFRGFSTFAARPLINLHDLAVLPQFRRRGIGGRLLEAV